MGTVIRLRFLLMGLFLLSGPVFSQSLIRGIVVDSATFANLPYVNIQVKHSFKGTTTDINGSFSILATPHDTLIFSLLGYKKLELALADYEPGIIRLMEQPTLLRAVIVSDSVLFENPYEGMFDEQEAKLKKKIPFYYHKTRKDKIKAANWRAQSLHVQTYVDVVINEDETKNALIKRYDLTEKEYYETLALFNEQNYAVMYYLTRAELVSFLNKFFEAHVPRKK